MNATVIGSHRFSISIFYRSQTVIWFGITQDEMRSTRTVQILYEYSCCHWTLELSWFRKFCWTGNWCIKVSINVKDNKITQRSPGFVAFFVWLLLFMEPFCFAYSFLTYVFAGQELEFCSLDFLFVGRLDQPYNEKLTLAPQKKKKEEKHLVSRKALLSSLHRFSAPPDVG